MGLAGRKLAAAGVLVAMGLAGALGSDASILTAHQVPPAPDASTTTGTVAGTAESGSASAADALPGTGEATGAVTGATGEAQGALNTGTSQAMATAGGAQGAVAAFVPTPATGLPIAAAAGLAPARLQPLLANLVGQAAGPHDALLSATCSASGLAVAGADVCAALDLGEAPPGTPVAALADASALLTAGLDLRGDLQRPLLEAAKAQGLSVARAVPKALPTEPGALEQAILRMYQAIGFAPTAEQRAQLHDSVLALDPDLAIGTAAIVGALVDADAAMQRILGKLTTEEYNLLYQCGQATDDGWGYACADPLRAKALAQAKLDRRAMTEAALMVLAAVEQATPLLDQYKAGLLQATSGHRSSSGGSAAPTTTAESGSEQEYHDDADTFADPTLLIQIGGQGNDVYTGNRLFETEGLADSSAKQADSSVQVLTLDFSGEDLYLNRAGGTSPSPLVAERSGGGLNDLVPHQDQSVGRQAAMFMAALALDYSGNDYYAGCRVTCQGAGYMGIGVLVEVAGNDQYSAETSSQGSGNAGVGLLFDVDGQDVYTSRYRSQGHGNLGGVGMLIDALGADRYTGEMLTQGAADGGGFGELLDARGGDQYRAVNGGATLSQGGALGGGFALFADGEGFDSYTSSQDAQGAVYLGAYPVGLGTALFLDQGTMHDTYTVPPRSGITPGDSRDWVSGALGQGFDNPQSVN